MASINIPSRTQRSRANSMALLLPSTAEKSRLFTQQSSKSYKLSPCIWHACPASHTHIQYILLLGDEIKGSFIKYTKNKQNAKRVGWLLLLYKLQSTDKLMLQLSYYLLIFKISSTKWVKREIYFHSRFQEATFCLLWQTKLVRLHKHLYNIILALQMVACGWNSISVMDCVPLWILFESSPIKHMNNSCLLIVP